MNTSESATRRKSAPGSRRRWHKRWTRASLWLTLLALCAFVVATVSICSTLGRDEKADGTEALLEQLSVALTNNHKATGALPETLLELTGVARGDIGREDAYGTTIRYTRVDSAKGTFEIRSAGPDKSFDTDDDVTRP